MMNRLEAAEKRYANLKYLWQQEIAKNAMLVEALRFADIFLTEFKDYGDEWDISRHNALRKIRIALAEVKDEQAN